MGKGKKKEKKTGKKKSKLGKQVPKDAAARKDQINVIQWRKKVKNLVVLLASGQGDAYQFGELRMALRVMIELVDEAENLTWNPVLRTAGCTSIVVTQAGRSGPGKEFTVPDVEPEEWVAHRAGTGKAPTTGAEGTIYERQKKHGSGGPSSVDLGIATTAWLKEHKPEALDSKVERLFREKGWKIIWTPPYCPKFQPIGLVWGVGNNAHGH